MKVLTLGYIEGTNLVESGRCIYEACSRLYSRVLNRSGVLKEIEVEQGTSDNLGIDLLFVPFDVTVGLQNFPFYELSSWFETGKSIIVSKPPVKYTSTNVSNALKIENHVSILLFFSIVVVVLVQRTILRVLFKKTSSFFEIFSAHLKPFVNQGLSLKWFPLRESAKIMLSFYLVFAFVVSIYITSNCKSKFTDSGYIKIDTFEQLLQDTTVEPRVLLSSNEHVLITKKAETDDVMKRLLERLTETNGLQEIVNLLAEGIIFNEILEGKKAVIISELLMIGSAPFAFSSLKDDLIEKSFYFGQESLSSSVVALPLNRTLPPIDKELINRAILKQVESRAEYKCIMSNNFLMHKKTWQPDMESSQDPLKLDDVGAVFLLWIFGNGLALVLSLMEVLSTFFCQLSGKRFNTSYM